MLGKKTLFRVISLVAIVTFVFSNIVDASVVSAFKLRPKAKIILDGGSAIKKDLVYFGSGIRTELKVPEGQPKEFFTNVYHSFRIDGLLAEPIEQIPDEVVDAVRAKLDQDIAGGKILSAVTNDFAATDIDIHITHRYGELNAAVHRLILEAIREGALKAQELGLLKQGIDVNSMSLADLAKELRLIQNENSLTERGAEPVVVAKIIGAGIGAANIKLFHEFAVEGSTPLKKLGLPGTPGFRFIVRRTEDILQGNFEGPVWEFEISSARSVKGKFYPSVNEGTELLVYASQPNDYQITAVYPVEGGKLPTTEALATVIYQPVYAEEGKARTLNPTIIYRSQSGADAVGGIGGMVYDVNFVPGGPLGEHFVVTKPVTLDEARRAPEEGLAHVVVYGWQGKANGVIPKEEGGIIDHIGMNPEAVEPERDLADTLASVMTTHKYDQPYLSSFAAQEQVAAIREEQRHYFTRAPKEADIDPIMEEVEAKVASGEYLSVTDDKADMGGKFGHNFTPDYMLAIDLATTIEAQEKGMLSDGNIIGFVDKTRLKGTTLSIGDDSHILMLGDKSQNSAEGHQLSFLAFTRGFLASMAGNTKEFDPEKPYGRGQDFAGAEAKAAMANPYFYSRFSGRFFEILREVMPLDYMQMVDNMEVGWKRWQKTDKEMTVLPEPFSGNVSQQGIGSARYLVDVAAGERTFDIIAGDKMGPAALNRLIREGVYAALKAGEFKEGLVFEIWDAKAFDEEGNIPIDELPESYADVADAITSLENKDEQDFVKNSYLIGGMLKNDLTVGGKKELAKLLKKAGYVPTQRIFFDAQEAKQAIYLYLADSDRFNIKQVWSKKRAGWDINNPQDYLAKPVLGSSVTKLGILAGGEYIGKDDPVMVGITKLMNYLHAFLKENPLIIQGDMNGSHWLAAIPTAFENAVASKDSHPILIGFHYTLSEDGKTLKSVEDIYGGDVYKPIRKQMFVFNRQFKKAQLDGQFEPYGTNFRTVEASYPLAKQIKLQGAENSPFLVKNKPKAERESRPTGIIDETAGLFNIATGAKVTEDLAKQQRWISAKRTWGENLAPFAEAFLSDIHHRVSAKVKELNDKEEGKVYPILINHESLLKASPEGIMAMMNIGEQLGKEGNVKFVLHLDRNDIKQEDIDSAFSKINEINNGYTTVNRDMFAAVVTGTNPQVVSNQVREKFGTGIYQVIGPAGYVNQFKDVIRVILDRPGEGQMTLMAKAMKLGLELIPKDGKMSQEELRQLDTLFSMDGEGNFHVSSGDVVASILAKAEKYEKAIEATLRI
ncbi:MAG: fructose 1,6-bisphosphatase [Candidatus Omnitrophica bacterium]|nr:fructose 1,6-bisphosphatase [Candidatus Omnitrophota bacterium]